MSRQYRQGRKQSPLQRNRSHGRPVSFLSLELLEPRWVLAASALFDPDSGMLSIVGDKTDNDFTLGVSTNSSIQITHNGQTLIPIDTTTQLPCDQGGTCPTTGNLVELNADLGGADDRLEYTPRVCWV